MSQYKIPDFTETELWAVRSTLKERYGSVLQVESDHMRKQKISTDQQPAQSAKNAPENRI